MRYYRVSIIVHFETTIAAVASHNATFEPKLRVPFASATDERDGRPSWPTTADATSVRRAVVPGAGR